MAAANSAADSPAATANAPASAVAAPPRDFPALAFSALLNVAAILFGVFGFLYSVYALYSSMATPAAPARAPICVTLGNLCRGLAVLFVVTTALEAYALALMLPFAGWGEGGLALGLSLLLVSVTGVSVWVAFWLME